MKRLVAVLLSVPVLFALVAVDMSADPPPEDVLRPQPDPAISIFLQPNIGLNYSFLTTSPIRGLNTGETGNDVIESGDGANFHLGLDIGAVFSEHWSARIGFAFDRRSFGNQGTADNICTIFDPDDPFVVFDTIDVETDVDYGTHVDYFNITESIDYRWNSIFGFLGFGIGIPLSGEYNEDVTILGDDNICYYFPGAADSTKLLREEMTDDMSPALRAAFRLGGGYIASLGETTELVFQVNYDHPLTDMLTEDETLTYQNPSTPINTFVGVMNGGARFGTIQASVGIRFNHIIDIW